MQFLRRFPSRVGRQHLAGFWRKHERSMVLRRFYVEKIMVSRDRCVIRGSEAKHMTKVLRMKPGDHAMLTDGEGRCFKTCIESASSREVLLLLEERLPTPRPSPVKITICQALLKSRAMDYLIQKTSELGVDCIVPFFSERTVIRIEQDRFDNKMRHWHEIAINAAKQCGRTIPAKIEHPCRLGELAAKFGQNHGLKVVFWEDESTMDLKQVLKTLPPAKHVVGIIGPEGGVTREEITTLREAGFVSVSLGTRILRAETAAITLAALVQYELGDLSLSAAPLTSL